MIGHQAVTKRVAVLNCQHNATLYRLLPAAPSATNAPVEYTQEANREFVGLDLPGITNGCSATVSTLQGCASLCAATAGCSAFSYTGARASCVGGCWLKYGRGSSSSRTTSERWTSGVLTGTSYQSNSVCLLTLCVLVKGTCLPKSAWDLQAKGL
jgi:hypothetical protein